MNWKRDGYKQGDNVYIIKKSILGTIERELIGEIISAGTKNMKVMILKHNKSKILAFNANGVFRAESFIYSVYKSKEEYKKFLKEKQYRAYLISNIIKGLDNASLDTLFKINDMV